MEAGYLDVPLHGNVLSMNWHSREHDTIAEEKLYDPTKKPSRMFVGTGFAARRCTDCRLVLLYCPPQDDPQGFKRRNGV
jgi:hypothetical protein